MKMLRLVEVLDHNNFVQAAIVRDCRWDGIRVLNDNRTYVGQSLHHSILIEYLLALTIH